MVSINPIIVVDKSWLQGANSSEIVMAASNYNLLLTDMLLYELTTTKRKMKECFKKILSVIDKCLYIENVGTLLRHEIQNNLPCAPFLNKPFIRQAREFIQIFQQIASHGLTAQQEKIAQEEFIERENKEIERTCLHHLCHIKFGKSIDPCIIQQRDQITAGSLRQARL